MAESQQEAENRIEGEQARAAINELKEKLKKDAEDKETDAVKQDQAALRAAELNLENWQKKQPSLIDTHIYDSRTGEVQTGAYIAGIGALAVATYKYVYDSLAQVKDWLVVGGTFALGIIFSPQLEEGYHGVRKMLDPNYDTREKHLNPIANQEPKIDLLKTINTVIGGATVPVVIPNAGLFFSGGKVDPDELSTVIAARRDDIKKAFNPQATTNAKGPSKSFYDEDPDDAAAYSLRPAEVAITALIKNLDHYPEQRKKALAQMPNVPGFDNKALLPERPENPLFSKKTPPDLATAKEVYERFRNPKFHDKHPELKEFTNSGDWDRDLNLVQKYIVDFNYSLGIAKKNALKPGEPEKLLAAKKPSYDEKKDDGEKTRGTDFSLIFGTDTRIRDDIKELSHAGWQQRQSEAASLINDFLLSKKSPLELAPVDKGALPGEEYYKYLNRIVSEVKTDMETKFNDKDKLRINEGNGPGHDEEGYKRFCKFQKYCQAWGRMDEILKTLDGLNPELKKLQEFAFTTLQAAQDKGLALEPAAPAKTPATAPKAPAPAAGASGAAATTAPAAPAPDGPVDEAARIVIMQQKFRDVADNAERIRLAKEAAAVTPAPTINDLPEVLDGIMKNASNDLTVTPNTHRKVTSHGHDYDYTTAPK